MGNVTRHALRVYASLAQLRGNNADVLDALIPFFEPILEKLNGTVFSPAVFAKGVHFLYRWRFNKDIAEQFIPRLERKGFLEKQAEGRDTFYLVKYERQAAAGGSDISEILDRIIDDFEQFPPRVTDLLTYSRTREQLKDILIKFLVAMDAYGDGLQRARAEEIARDDTELLAKLDDGGPPFNKDDRYMAARFVKAISIEKPEWIPHLARLAAIGLLTEVVADFVKPVQPTGKVNLTVVVDAPLALDFLGCSGKSLQQDVKSVFEALRAIGCSFVVFPASCVEMRRNLTSMLSLPPPKRHGYTHEAMAKGEVLRDFVEAVANDPEGALAKVGIATKHLSLDQYPNSHIFFSEDRYQDFFEIAQWVPEIKPREHDAESMTLVMRLREGKHSGDVFKCGYVFVTRNAKFVRTSRQYCIESGLITPFQQGPLIHQRELATVTWLRTGLGEEGDEIPINSLLANCDRVLQLRAEVPNAVAAMLKEVTPDKIEQFELLLQDHKSIRKLADETLNDENVVTADNAEHLLEVMRLATVEEERAKFEQKIDEQKALHRERQRDNRDKLRAAETAQAELAARAGNLAAQQTAIISGLAAALNSQLKFVAAIMSGAMAAIILLAILQYITGWLTDSHLWVRFLDFAALLGAYHLIMAVLGKPMFNLTTFLNFVAPHILQKRLDQLNLDHVSISDFKFTNGTVVYSPGTVTSE